MPSVLPKYKVIEGITYAMVNHYKYKSGATIEASKFRQNGYNARVIKGKYHAASPIGYAVYVITGRHVSRSRAKIGDRIIR